MITHYLIQIFPSDIKGNYVSLYHQNNDETNLKKYHPVSIFLPRVGTFLISCSFQILNVTLIVGADDSTSYTDDCNLDTILENNWNFPQYLFSIVWGKPYKKGFGKFEFRGTKYSLASSTELKNQMFSLCKKTGLKLYAFENIIKCMDLEKDV